VETFDNQHHVDAAFDADSVCDIDPMSDADLMHTEETVCLTRRQVIRRFCQNVFWLPTQIAAIIAAMALIMSIGFTMAGVLPNLPVLWQLFFLPVALFAATWVVSFLFTVPMLLLVSFSTKRTITIEDRELVQRTGLRTLRLPLAESSWQVTDRAGDIAGNYFGFGTLVQVQSEQNVIVCGFEYEQRERWIRLLENSAACRVTGGNRRRMWLQGTAITVLAAALGAVGGAALSVALDNSMMIASGLMIGALDGSVLALGLLYWMPRTNKMVTRRFSPWLVTLLFFVTAMKFSTDLVAMLFLAVTNAGMGWLCGRYIQARAWRTDELTT